MVTQPSRYSPIRQAYPFIGSRIQSAHAGSTQVHFQANRNTPTLSPLKKRALGLFSILALLTTAARPSQHIVQTSPIEKRVEQFITHPNVSFQYFVPDSEGRYQETEINPDFENAQRIIVLRMVKLLWNRPELLTQLEQANNGLTINLYDGYEIDPDTAGYVQGITTDDSSIEALLNPENMALSMGFAIRTVDVGLTDTRDGYEVVAHELAHAMDRLKLGEVTIHSSDGLLPGWSLKTIKSYMSARTEEIRKISEGTSPLRDYALENNFEFLAVLAEAFFEQPEALKASNSVLYTLMEEFFQQTPSTMPTFQNRDRFSEDRRSRLTTIYYSENTLLINGPDTFAILRKAPESQELEVKIYKKGHR